MQMEEQAQSNAREAQESCSKIKELTSQLKAVKVQAEERSHSSREEAQDLQSQLKSAGSQLEAAERRIQELQVGIIQKQIAAENLQLRGCSYCAFQLSNRVMLSTERLA